MPRTEYFADAQPVTLEEMLDARERRAENQRTYLRRHRCALVCFTMNLAGAYKCYPLARRAFALGLELVEVELRDAGYTIVFHHRQQAVSGCEAYYAVDAQAEEVKRRMVAVEEGHPLGRLYDLDVLDADGNALRGVQHGRAERRCLICEKPVWRCARSRAHSAEALALRTAEIMDDYFIADWADRVAALAVRALLCEVAATPKPGLVDRANNGAHRDMDLYTFIDSSCALTAYFRDVTATGARYDGPAHRVLEAVRFRGKLAEREMLAATGGVNTHKGLIFSMGLVCTALGYLYNSAAALTPALLLETCAAIAGEAPRELDCGAEGADTTGGQRIYNRYGLTGVRGEAAAGFPGVAVCYPVLRALREQGTSLNDAGVIALLHLMSEVTDTNMISRGDLQTLRDVQRQVRETLERETDAAALLEYAAALDSELIRKNLSPGGCADLLAICYMLLFVFDEKDNLIQFINLEN